MDLATVCSWNQHLEVSVCFVGSFELMLTSLASPETLRRPTDACSLFLMNFLIKYYSFILIGQPKVLQATPLTV